jgi:hypothetical protein
MAKHRGAFNPKAFLSTTGVGRQMMSFRKRQTPAPKRCEATSRIVEELPVTFNDEKRPTSFPSKPASERR